MNTSTHSDAKRWAVAIGAAILGIASLAAASYAQSAAAQTADGQVSGTVTTATSTAHQSGQIALLEAKIDLFESRIAALDAELDQLRAELNALQGGSGGNTGGTGTTTSPGSGGSGETSLNVTMYPQNATVRAGTNIDFNGRGFWADEQVYVMENGIIVATARADGGGNFSTGSLPVGTATGTFTVRFVGATSNLTGSATVTVVP